MHLRLLWSLTIPYTKVGLNFPLSNPDSLLRSFQRRLRRLDICALMGTGIGVASNVPPGRSPQRNHPGLMPSWAPPGCMGGHSPPGGPAPFTAASVPTAFPAVPGAIMPIAP